MLDPRTLTCVVIGHMHADHYLDLAGLRYLFPWAGEPPVRLPVHLPPGGRPRLDALASAISERPGFFDDAFAVDEYDPEVELAVGPLRLRFMRGQHYVPAWGVSIVAPDGARLVYTGDTGPSEAMTEFARGCDVLLVEATLRDAADDDPRRGHLTPEEAIELATDADAGRDPARPLSADAPPRARSHVRRDGTIDPSRGRGSDPDHHAGSIDGGPAGLGARCRPPATPRRELAPLRQEIVRTGWADAWAARTLMCAATALAIAVIASPAGPCSRWATAGTPTSPPWRTVMSSGMPPR